MQNNEDLLTEARIKIFLGEFGSGKTELAVNYALRLKKQGYNTAIIDIDLLKPYFRTRENRALLEDQGVEVVAPEQKFSQAALPVLPNDVTRLLYQQDCQLVMDVGGGESSIALGQFHQRFAENPYIALLVVNTCRPFTANAVDIVDAFHRIEQSSRLKITGLVSNTNIAGETTAAHVLEGLAVVEEAAAALSLPIRWVVVPEWLSAEVEVPYPVFVLRPYTMYPWMGE
ncbi:MAG: hypothetical protein P4N41_25455 [Negativicutes bacterium]|nr:hypothetical protein [Negativicutes bacterium]